MTKAEFSPAAALAFVKETARPRDPDAVLAALDEFGWAKAWHMSVGDEKGVILDEELRKVDPLMTVVELGTFVGYSAVRIARLLPPGGKVYTIDPEVERTNTVAKEVVAFAGLADKVEFVPGTAAEALPKLSAREELKGKVDCVFIDHHKDYYLSDLQLIEKLGLLRPGALVVADNVV
ncbi:MAG: S-adenosyl-L-methionine-dependent methyltransferase, partial [Olpidium bornovanus]